MTSNVITTSNDTNTTYPPLHHREAEHLREELETIHNLDIAVKSAAILKEIQQREVQP